MALVQTAKELLRAIAIRLGVYHLFRPGERVAHLNISTLEGRFAHIYDTRLWALGDPDTPSSGSGSGLDATANVRRELPKLLEKIGTRTLLDVGCGDFTWMRTVPLGGIDYVGVDIVEGLIDENAKNFGREGIRFVQANAVSDPLPEADTVLIREVLFHLSFEDAMAVLRNLLSKPRDYLLITTDRQPSLNFDIPSGDYRMLNLEARPFKFPEPEFFIEEKGKVPQRRLAAWKADDIRAVLGGRRKPGAPRP